MSKPLFMRFLAAIAERAFLSMFSQAALSNPMTTALAASSDDCRPRPGIKCTTFFHTAVINELLGAPEVRKAWEVDTYIASLF
jgi:hypothetical protein